VCYCQKSWATSLHAEHARDSCAFLSTAILKSESRNISTRLFAARSARQNFIECKSPATRHRASATRGGGAHTLGDGTNRPIQPQLEEKTPDEIRALIRTAYDLDPAKTMDLMIYKRVAKSKTFY